MSDYSAMTKAALLEQIGALKLEIQHLQPKATAGVKVPERPIAEADALRECIRAMDFLRDAERAASTMNYSSIPMLGTPVRQVGTAERVLRHLADKYGVPLFQVELKDCNRKHVDELPYEVARLLA